MCLIYWVMDIARLYFIEIAFNYNWINDCLQIETQFKDNSNSFYHWATIDKDYIDNGQSTGIY